MKAVGKEDEVIAVHSMANMLLSPGSIIREICSSAGLPRNFIRKQLLLNATTDTNVT